MQRLNYNHLLYFYTIAKLGSVSAASEELSLSQPTVSAQLKTLENEIGEKLFKRQGRYLVLTQSGELVLRYCKQIFDLGHELTEHLSGRTEQNRDLLRIGVSDVVPKQLAYEIISPIYTLDPVPRLQCIEEDAQSLLARLALHEIDMVLADCPIPPSINIVAYNHVLGSCGVSFVASRALTAESKRKFPKNLEELPLLLPSAHSAVRRSIDQWFQVNQVKPNIQSEFQDSALMKIFGREGRGVFPVPSAIESHVVDEFGVRVMGRISEPIQHFYLISTERRLKRGLTSLIWDSAHRSLFLGGAKRAKRS